MSVKVGENSVATMLNHNLQRASKEHADALAKLSTGQVFTKDDPRPSERALAEGLQFKLRSIAASKKNINDAVSLLQTAESSMAEIGNMILRMKELNISAATSQVSDQERRFLMLEYQALHDELNRIAQTTEFNGIPLLNGDSDRSPAELIIRVGDPFTDGDTYDERTDVNTIRFSGLKDITSTPEALGLRSAIDYLASSNSEEGITAEDMEELLLPEDSDTFGTVYDQAMNKLSEQRAVYGSLQTRLDRAIDFMDVYQENIAAAKSKIADTDYAEQVSRMTHAQILMNASTSLLAQSNIHMQNSFAVLNHALG